MRFKLISGSCIHNTNNGTAPASTTDCANVAVWLAIYPNAQAAASLTEGSNSSKHNTNASKAPADTTAWANSGLCFATARKTKAAAFL